MARNEKRGKRDKAQRQREQSGPVGPHDDPEEHAPGKGELDALRPNRKFIDENEDEE